MLLSGAAADSVNGVQRRSAVTQQVCLKFAPWIIYAQHVINWLSVGDRFIIQYNAKGHITFLQVSQSMKSQPVAQPIGSAPLNYFSLFSLFLTFFRLSLFVSQSLMPPHCSFILS